ncbi:MAG TPA: DegT/DnrJ/EryC1/StrS family aminotransferase [Gemmatimonadetes bacterium]|nr:DegT/DnrJ/EryC1/StrS family aminotransferase [Gemmatimonadota bacterium]
MRVPATAPSFSEEDISFITHHFTRILRGESFLSMYVFGEEFETRFAEYTGTDLAVACSSGTSALELIFRALDVQGREVIVPSNTFLATAIAVLNAGGIPVFADCGDDMSLDPADVASRVTEETAAITQVHIGGIVSEGVLQTKALCEERGIHLVEDAAQAHGSVLNGQKAGTFGTAAGFSFFSTKVMTTGEGGMVTTNDPSLVRQMKSSREFGKVKKGVYVNYHETLGYNWRMPEVAALMGLRQLESLDSFIERRREIVRRYDELLAEIEDVTIVHQEGHDSYNGFKYMIVLPDHERVKVHQELGSMGVSPSGYIYEIPLHKLPVFPESNDLSLPKTEFVCRQHLCLPVFVGMSDEQVDYVAESLQVVLANDDNRLSQ